MTELLLVRHARPISGVVDAGLSEEGLWQAERVADWLSVEGFDALYTSPFRRTRETAAAIERRMAVTATVVPDLREWDRDLPGGETVYIAPEDIDPALPQARALAEGRYDDFVPELDRPAFQRRAVDVMNGLLDAHPSGRVVAVTHGGITNAYLALVIGAPRIFWFNPGYTSVSRVRKMSSGNVTVTAVNDVAHLITDRRVNTSGPVPAPSHS